MKKLLGVALFTIFSLGSTIASEAILLDGTGGCFSTYTFVYNAAIANGATTIEAHDIAYIAFETCLQTKD